MTKNSQEPTGSTVPVSTLGRQLIFSSVALVIIGLGAWSMWSQNAPYHPDVSSQSVTRGDTSVLNGISTDN